MSFIKKLKNLKKIMKFMQIHSGQNGPISLKKINNFNFIGGLQPDKIDIRDFIYKPTSKVYSLDPSVDLRQYAKEIEDQGRIGSCVGNATSSCLELISKSIHNMDKNFSRLFIYWNARLLGDISGDNGAYLRDGIKSCNKWGICEENYWEYDESKVNTQPDSQSYEEARKNRAITYERIAISDINSIKEALSNKRSVIIGMGLAESFYDINGDLSTQNYEGINDNNELIGGHALNVVGYDDNLNGGSFIVENSWGTSWGDNGYFALKYTVWLNDGWDAWVCTKFNIDMEPTDPDYVPEDFQPDIPINFDEKIDNFLQEAAEYFNGPFAKSK